VAQFPLPADAAPAEADDEVLAQIALSRSEYELACEMLGRAPSDVELGMIGALWSEHCGYKHSRPLFHHFPTEDERILTNLGEENAGAIDIGGGLVAVMTIESHNHPSPIEPYEGAATGVGCTLRPLFATSAPPIALLYSPPSAPTAHRRNPTSAGRVVARRNIRLGRTRRILGGTTPGRAGRQSVPREVADGRLRRAGPRSS